MHLSSLKIRYLCPKKHTKCKQKSINFTHPTIFESKSPPSYNLTF